MRTIIKTSNAAYSEARFQSRQFSEVSFVNGELERIRVVESSGCGIRVLVRGCWGFSSSSIISKPALSDAQNEAISMAKVLSERKKNRVKSLASSRMARGSFNPLVRGSLADISLEEKAKTAKEAEVAARKHNKDVKAASSVYREILDFKVIVNSDGGEVVLYDSKPEFNVTAIAKKGGENVTASESIGITGGWNDLFDRKSHLDYAYIAADKAANLASARHLSGETTQIILDPGMVGLLSHEAIGHTVEADFVLSGSLAKDKMGTQVASELVTLVDSGKSEIVGHAGGSIAVDDEGIESSKTTIIEKGFLKSYLHNRESASLFDVPSTGNARAFTFSDEPLIRMRNTFVEPGTSSLEEMIKETKHGYLIRGPRNGQADSNGEFMFGAQEAFLIENGEQGDLKRGASISGNAFEVLRSIDMVGNQFEYDMGAGYCGKYQPAKVDGGGPFLRCIATVGGLQ